MNCFAQSAYNFKVIFLIDHTTLCQEFIMHHAIAIEENSEQNLYIWPNLMWFSRSWLFWKLLLRWLGFGFNVILVHTHDSLPVMNFLSNSGSSLNVANIFWRCPCDMRQKKMRKSNIHNPWNLKITVIFWSHLVCIVWQPSLLMLQSRSQRQTFFLDSKWLQCLKFRIQCHKFLAHLECLLTKWCRNLCTCRLPHRVSCDEQMIIDKYIVCSLFNTAIAE